MTLDPTSQQYAQMKFGRTDGSKRGPKFQKEALLSVDNTTVQRSKVIKKWVILRLHKLNQLRAVGGFL